MLRQAWMRPLAAASVWGLGLIALVGSGGGGGGDDPTPEPPPPTATAPQITTHPADQQVLPGATASFSVAATGTAPLAYQWRRNGNDIAGATAPGYSLVAALADSGASFSVTVSNSAGSVISNSAALTVSATAQAPFIITHPTSQARSAGQVTTFVVAATGTGPLSYQWLKRGVEMPGQTGNTLTLVAMSGDHGAPIQAVVRNAAGSATSNSATLSVTSAGSGTLNGAAISTAAGSSWMAATARIEGLPVLPPSNSTPTQTFNLQGVPASEHVVLRTAAAGHLDQLKVAAVRSGAVTFMSNWLSPLGDAQSVTPAAGGTLGVPGSAAQVSFPPDAFVRAQGGGAPSGNAVVTITPLPAAREPNGLPGNGTTLAISGFTWLDSHGAIHLSAVDGAGQPLQLAAGKAATLRVPLSTRDTAAPPASAALYGLDEGQGLWVERGSGTLGGSANARYFEATVASLGSWQAASAADVIQVRGCTTFSGIRTRNRSVRAEGIEATLTAWAFTDTNGDFAVAVRRNSRAVLYTNGGTESTAPIVVGPSASDIALAGCLAERGTMASAPSFVVQPQAATVAAGARVRLHAAVDGQLPIALQWRRNGVAIAGETGTALVFEASAADNGAVFTVAASNARGSTVSAAATLTVTP